MIQIKKAQAWSVDIVIAVVLFIAAFMFFYVLISGTPKSEKTAILVEDGEQLASMLASDSKISVVQENKLSDAKVEDLSYYTYDDIKRMAGLRSDFCLHFEDEYGNIVNVSGVASLGHPDANITFKTGKTLACGR